MRVRAREHCDGCRQADPVEGIASTPTEVNARRHERRERDRSHTHPATQSDGTRAPV